jgi:N-methylhydantoinase B/oxoprolinase/acetone carboxylase alpha subunit
MLVAFSHEQGLSELGTVTTRDQMDDGTPICLSVTIDRRDGSAVFDFEGVRQQRRLGLGRVFSLQLQASTLSLQAVVMTVC